MSTGVEDGCCWRCASKMRSQLGFWENEFWWCDFGKVSHQGQVSHQCFLMVLWNATSTPAAAVGRYVIRLCPLPWMTLGVKKQTRWQPTRDYKLIMAKTIAWNHSTWLMRASLVRSKSLAYILETNWLQKTTRSFVLLYLLIWRVPSGTASQAVTLHWATKRMTLGNQ